jgi:hypothetical protein
MANNSPIVYFEDELGGDRLETQSDRNATPRRNKCKSGNTIFWSKAPTPNAQACEEALNGRGRDGWELVTFYVNGAGDNVFVLKKPKEQ